MGRPTRDLKGMRFGKLEVIEFAGYKKGKYHSKAYWKCQCDCGNEKEIAATQLLSGITNSCGCLHFENKEKDDIVGKKYNRLTAIKRVYDGRKGVRYLFKCDCGKEKVILKNAVVSGTTKSCGCLSNEKVRERCFKDLTGQKFGRLTALRVDRNDNGKTYWFCKCDCGNTHIVLANRLISGNTVSCGCHKEEIKKKIGELNKTHEKSGTRIYRIYQQMISRCYKEYSTNYERYGGRGIEVCPEWRGENGFQNFYDWSMESGYKRNLTIDRINNDGNYEPSNCRWATNKEQANNRRTSRYIDVDGEKMTVAMFSDMNGIKSRLFVTRRLDKGYDYKKILEDYKKHMEGKEK